MCKAAMGLGAQSMGANGACGASKGLGSVQSNDESSQTVSEAASFPSCLGRSSDL